MTKELLQTDVLIIGSGIAGCSTALQIAKTDPTQKIIILSRSKDLNESNTNYAQGGIIAKGGRSLVEDILKSGDGFSLPNIAQVLAKEGPELVNEILKNFANVPFDTKKNELDFALEGGHKVPRVAKVADHTGHSIQNHLTETFKKFKNISTLTNLTAIDLITSQHQTKNFQNKYKRNQCLGVYAFDQKTSQVIRILAKFTVLATGGTGQVFAYTTNPKGARGDGIAMAYRAGAQVLNMEYQQFHPTALKLSGAPPFLISEAVRGEGARLTDSHATPFMQKYFPKMDQPDLNTRDKVSQSIFTEMLYTNTQNVYLDIKNYLPPKEIIKHFPTIYHKCLEYGLDITKQLIPVSPAAHYSCGGIKTNSFGQTSIKNLYAVGEVACTGLHGANRLASTSLLEGLVFGVRAGKKIVSKLSTTDTPQKNDILPWQYFHKFPADTALISADETTIKNIMWNMVGLVRKTKLLERAITDLSNLEDSINKYYREATLSDELLGLRNLVLVALIIARSAYSNHSSAGCHLRAD